MNDLEIGDFKVDCYFKDYQPLIEDKKGNVLIEYQE